MPFRIPIPARLFPSSLSFRSTLNPCVPVASALIATKTTLDDKKKHYDPYRLAQIKLRKDANISRQRELKEQHKAQAGSPVRGTKTPFLESFDRAGASAAEPGVTDSTGPLLNHFLTQPELEAALENSNYLASPIVSEERAGVDPVKEQEAIDTHRVSNKRATAAMKRIVALSNGSSFNRTMTNKIRCIEKFGRHNTDKFLKPRPPVNPLLLRNRVLAEKTPRAGPDTGSSEVQIAILTAKIRVLADNLEKHGGNKDKINKRNLRLMVHKRQKLLKYLHRKERGGERWQYLVNTLGLTKATWDGEISM